MSYQYATSDEVADMQRQMQREIEKAELRMESEIDEVRRRSSGKTISVDFASMSSTKAELQKELNDLRLLVVRQGSILKGVLATLADITDSQ